MTPDRRRCFIWKTASLFLPKHIIVNGVIVAKTVAVIVLMDSKKKITISWSGGKDAALALLHIFSSNDFEVVNLHCIINKETRRVGLHGVREQLIEEQARAIGIPIVKSYLPVDSSNQGYEALVFDLYRSFREQGISHILFGDIFLEDLKSYREALLRKVGLQPVFPLWGQASGACVEAVVQNNFRTIICAANEVCYANGLLGKVIDVDLIRKFPGGIDPSGENGEFHTFVFEAPYFKSAVGFSLGEVTSQVYQVNATNGDDNSGSVRFYFQDLLPSMNDLNASNNN